MTSILDTIKKLCGIPDDCTDFDVDMVIHINSVFDILYQLGVGPANGFAIEDNQAKWTDYIDDYACINMIKTYMYLKVRPYFEPTTGTGATIKSTEELLKELEWRIQRAFENNVLLSGRTNDRN